MLPFRLIIASGGRRICTLQRPNWGIFTYLTTKLGSIDTGKRFSDGSLHRTCTIFLQAIDFLTWRLHEIPTMNSCTEVTSETCLFAF